MASHLETTDVPLLYSPQYITVRGRVTTVDPHVQSILSSEYWDGPASSRGKNSAQGLGQTLRSSLGPKDDTPQMSSGRSRTPQQETSSLQKRLFTGMDGRSVVCLVNVPDRTGSRILAKDPHTTVIQFNMTFLTPKYITGEYRRVSFKTK